jgi:acetyl-CoA synthetase
VLDFLTRHPGGVRADEVAPVIDKSVSTAYYLLTSLCEEGFAVHDSHAGLYRPARELAIGDGPDHSVNPTSAILRSAVDELFYRTRKRSGVIEIAVVRGRQGMPKMPRLGAQIRDSAHAVAIGKVVLARLGREALDDYVSRGLRAFTSRTITVAETLMAELDAVRRNGYALDREEFDLEFCCVAAPILDGQGRFAAALAVSATTHAFDADHEASVTAVRDVAAGAGRGLGAAGP